jgi:hypothetical protein
MKEQILKQFDSLMSHLNSEENEMAEEFRAELEKTLTTKTLYLVAGGTDGYTSIYYYTNEQDALDAIEDDPESFGGMDSGPEDIQVPVWLYNE